MKKFFLLIITMLLFTSYLSSEAPGIDATTSDWKAYIDRTTITDAKILERLFNYYEKVKDDPFLELGIKETIESEIFSSGYGARYFKGTGVQRDYIYTGTYDIPPTYELRNVNQDALKELYTCLSDWMDMFTVIDAENKKTAIAYFCNDQINETFLFDDILSTLNQDGSGLYKVDSDIKNISHPENGLVIKYNGKETGGFLGGYPEFEYTIDYNGKKDIPVKNATFIISFKDNIADEYTISNWENWDWDELPPAKVKGLLVGDHFYIDYFDFDYIGMHGYTLRNKETGYEPNIMSFFNRLTKLDETNFGETIFKSVELVE